MAYYVLFDTETTGNQDDDKVIQFGAMIVDQKGKVEAFDELCSTKQLLLCMKFMQNKLVQRLSKQNLLNTT